MDFVPHGAVSLFCTDYISLGHLAVTAWYLIQPMIVWLCIQRKKIGTSRKKTCFESSPLNWRTPDRLFGTRMISFAATELWKNFSVHLILKIFKSRFAPSKTIKHYFTRRIKFYQCVRLFWKILELNLTGYCHFRYRQSHRFRSGLFLTFNFLLSKSDNS